MAHIVNQYGEKVIGLVSDGFGFFQLPEGFIFDNLSIGDTYKVVAGDGNESEE